MLNDEEHGCGSIGRSVALLCAGLGVGAAVLMLLALGISKFFILPFPFPKEILVGLVVLFIAAASLGKRRGSISVTRLAPQVGMCWLELVWRSDR